MTEKTTEREVASDCCWWQKFPFLRTLAVGKQPAVSVCKVGGCSGWASASLPKTPAPTPPPRAPGVRGAQHSGGTGFTIKRWRGQGTFCLNFLLREGSQHALTSSVDGKVRNRAVRSWRAPFTHRHGTHTSAVTTGYHNVPTPLAPFVQQGELSAWEVSLLSQVT